MNVLLNGQPYTLDADYATDTGAFYQWAGTVPRCVCCEEPLEDYRDDFDVYAGPNGTYEIVCHYCGEVMPLAEVPRDRANGR